MIDYLKIPEERLELLKKKREWIDQLEKLGGVKVSLNEEVCIEGDDPLKVLRVKEVLRAFGRGFSFDDALLLLDEDYYLLIIDVKSFAGKSRSRLATLKGRVIGTGGKTKRRIEECTNTRLAIYGKTVSIVGKWEDVEKARKAVEMLLQGRMHSTVYRYLEKVASS